MSRDYHRIRAWQEADALALAVYLATRTFPKSEVFALTSQMRRAALSVPANIVEGSARGSQREYVHFLRVAAGSLAELGYFVDVARRVGYLTESGAAGLAGQHITATKTLHALINHIERNPEP